MKEITNKELLEIIITLTGNTIKELKENETLEELEETITHLNFDGYDDIEIEGEEYRFIPSHIIREIFKESAEQFFDDVFMSEVPEHIAPYVCFEKWFRGYDFGCSYWNHFATYDGEEHYNNGVYLFRIN